MNDILCACARIEDSEVEYGRDFLMISTEHLFALSAASNLVRYIYPHCPPTSNSVAEIPMWVGLFGLSR
jgi:hypothetical protein